LAGLRVLYTAAHAGAGAGVPIGGGGAIARMLAAEWEKSKPFAFEVLRPQQDAPEDIVGYSRSEYTAFCYRFRDETTRRILQEDPREIVVLSNDISEGPDFAALAAKGYRIVTVWHVDVLAFVARTYLRGVFRPETLARIARPFEAWLPGPLGLVFANQHNCVRYSAAHVVMTDAMKQTILRCYPETPAAKVQIAPWGVAEHGEGRANHDRPLTILTLSRISPEKGQHRLLRALRGYKGRLRVVIAGEAAFMGGAAYAAKLRRLAAELPHVEVVFPGHLSGQAKWDAFASADLYAFPSVSESYGLTLMEALSHGLPAVAFDHDGAKAILQPQFGVLVRDEASMLHAFQELLADRPRRQRMSEAAKLYVRSRPFAAAARQVAEVILAIHS
jgi:glycosyltransferase involved in cell wall biosynthesis